MPFIPFWRLFPQVAKKETRVLIAFSDSELPAGEYELLEMYCDEADCDCRRVLFAVYSQRNQQFTATITFGWEEADFYSQWLGNEDPELMEELMGPALNRGSSQSPLAPAVLEQIKPLFMDREYVERVKNHYTLFKTALKQKSGQDTATLRGGGIQPSENPFSSHGCGQACPQGCKGHAGHL